MRAEYETGRRGFGGHHHVDLRLETRTSPQYGAAKAAEIYLAIELGRELAPERIRVNAVSPGSILFPGGGWDSLRERDPERLERFIQRDLPFGVLVRLRRSPMSSRFYSPSGPAGLAAPTSA